MDLDALRKELIRDEGFKLDAYKDSLGFWTIGVGHLLGVKQRMVEITVDEMHALLDYDIQLALLRAKSLIPTFDSLDDVRQRALTNMAFNLGNKLRMFENFLAAVARQDWAAAGTHMADSLWAKQVGDRAGRLRKMIEEGTAP